MINKNLSYIEISKDNLIHNIKQFRNFVGGDVKIAAVVKANAYGHGDKEVARIASSHVDYFQVDSIEECERIRNVTGKPIIILGYLNEDGVGRAIKCNAEVCVFDFDHALLINKVAKKKNKIVKVHVAVDSYLGREGIMPEEVKGFINKVKKLNSILIEGIYSHFANIEDTMNFTHANRQIDTYHKCLSLFKENGFSGLKTHISATSGILVYEKKNNLHNIVRLGIGLYGMWPSEHLEFLNKKNINLKPIIKWVTHVAQVKVIPANYPIGYGLTYITKKKTKIAVIPQGYYDGLSRSLSNNGEFLIKGKRTKILGRVAMNMTVVDVSKIADIKAGDPVVILGEQKYNDKVFKITAEEIAKNMGTINYEITTKITALLPRKIV